MEKRYGSILILIKDFRAVNAINTVLSAYAQFILSRTGLPIHNIKMSLMSIIVEATSQEINALSGKIGRIPFVEVKSCMHKPLENKD